MTTIEGQDLRRSALFQNSHHTPPDAPIDDAALGKLMVFSGVREYPVRIKCATLAWHAVAAALEGERDAPVSTE